MVSCFVYDEEAMFCYTVGHPVKENAVSVGLNARILLVIILKCDAAVKVYLSRLICTYFSQMAQITTLFKYVKYVF